MEWRIWAAIIGAAGAWGTTGVATRAALNDGVPPLAMVAIRALLAAALLFVVLRARGTRVNRNRRAWRLGIVAGIFQLSTPFLLFTLAYQYASAGFVGMIVALVPLATAIAAHLLLPDEKLHLAKSIGLVIAFGGVAFLLLSGDSGLGEEGRPLLAAVLSFGAVASIAYSSVYAKRHAGTYDPVELTWMQFTVGIAVVGGAMLAAEGMPATISPWGWTLILYLTVIGSVVPFLLFYWLLGHVTSTKASLIGYVVPLIALGAGAVLLDERLEAGIIGGGVLILVGVVLTDRAERYRPAAPSPM
jgi:drug/metabolite transporter (DMT)-like permease